VISCAANEAKVIDTDFIDVTPPEQEMRDGGDITDPARF
jgi:hypothetical protein